MADAGRRAGGRGGGPGGVPGLTLVVEAEGLASRFGRPVPDIEALLHRLGNLQRDAAERGQRFDLVPGGDPDAALSRSEGGRVMALCGSEAMQQRFLAHGLPAYLLTDRHERDHRRLAVSEADRVVAEALRMPVPRPMSDQVRTGSLLAAPVGDPAEARELGTVCLARDPRADWLVLGDTMVAYAEREEAAAALRSAGGRLLGESVNLGEVSVSSRGVAAGDRLLFEHAPDGSGLQAPAEALQWSACRRAVFGPERALASEGDSASPAILHENQGLRALTFPFADTRTERIIAIIDPTANMPDGLADELRAQGVPAALVWLSGRDADPGVLPRFLWDRELHNLAVLAAQDLAATPAPPWTRCVELQGPEAGRSRDLARRLAAAYPA